MYLFHDSAFLVPIGEDKIPKADAFECLARQLVREHPTHIPLLKEILSKHDVDGETDESVEKTVSRFPVIGASDMHIPPARDRVPAQS